MLYSNKFKEITMKKTLLLSVVASTMIMAGGDIAPVEPVVEAPAAAASAWEFGGQGVLYYQTNENFFTDNGLDNSLFDQESSQASAGIQLRATNADLFAGIGAGVEVSGLATLGLQDDVVSNVMQAAGAEQFGRGGWVSQAYLTYGFDNTSIKVGRQTLPASLSPFAHSEYWNVFANTYDAALIVNTDISNTTLVGAWVKSANQNGYFGYPNSSFGIRTLSSSQDVGGLTIPGNMASFDDLNDANNENGIFMLTAQNKSIEGLTLTGTWYYANEFITTDDLNILWGDAKFNISDFTVGLQGGAVMHDALDDETTAFGAMVGTKLGMFDASVAYSTVNDSDLGVFNLGGQQTPLYTQMVINEFAIANANDTFVVRAGVEALGGNINAAYGMTSSDYTDNDYNELDLSYTTKLFDSVDLTAAYVNMDHDVDSNNLVRLIGRYNF